MKTTAVIVSRNDNYGGNLIERSTYCINSSIETYDEVIYVDWNSPTHSLLWDIEDNINFKGNLKHFIITPEIAKHLTNFDLHAQVCCEALARNIGLSRATGDWVISTNIDIIAPKKEDILNTIKGLGENSFYTISRREVELSTIKEFFGGDVNYQDWTSLRDHLISTSEERHFDEKTVTGDDYSIINCCGDYQIAHKNVWNTIRGMEEDLIYSLYTDTNVQKKAVMHGFGLKALYNPAFFHINHGRGGGGFLDGINRKTNDPRRAILGQNQTQNLDSWGFTNLEIEFELL
jgi:hypothetical protein